MRIALWATVISFSVGLIVLAESAPPAASNGPYTLSFKVVKAGAKITIQPNSFKVLDKDGQPVAKAKCVGEPVVSFVDGDKTIPGGKMTFS